MVRTDLIKKKNLGSRKRGLSKKQVEIVLEKYERKEISCQPPSPKLRR